jgi:hypothetical protein
MLCQVALELAAAALRRDAAARPLTFDFRFRQAWEDAEGVSTGAGAAASKRSKPTDATGHRRLLSQQRLNFSQVRKTGLAD